MADSALVIEELEKRFPAPQTGWRALLNPFVPLTKLALRGVSFEVGSGQAAALIGANGSGKSTLLRPLRWLARLIPVTYSLEGMRQALLSGAGMVQLWPSVRALLLFSVVLLPLSGLIFGWAVRRRSRAR